MLVPTQFSAILQAEQVLNSYSGSPLLRAWRDEFATVDRCYVAVVRVVRVSWWRRSRRPIPTFAQYLRSPEASDGLVGLLAYLATFPIKRYFLRRWFAKKMDRVALRNELRTIAGHVTQLDRLSMAVLAPTYQAFAESVRNMAALLKTQYPGATIDYGALSALAALVDRGQGFARDEPDWSSQRSVEVYIDPDNVAHRLVGQLDRLETFFNTSMAQSSGDAQKTIQSAKVLMENGLLGLLKSYWGIERMPIQSGDPYNSDSMISDGVIQPRSPREQSGKHVAEVISSGFTYNNGRIFRAAHVLVYGGQ